LNAIESVAVASAIEAFTDLWHRILNVGPKWLVALAVLVVAWLLARLARVLVRKVVGRTSTQGHVDLLLARAAAGLILIAGFMVALSEIGMSINAALAALGLASVGIGFALQDVLGNLFSGIILLVQHPFTIGDEIRVGEQEGVVENIRVRDTQILTYDSRRVFIPNKTVFDSSIINYSSNATTRIDLRLLLKEGADIARARAHAVKILEGAEGVLDRPQPAVLIDSDRESVVLVLRFWAESGRDREMNLKSVILEALIASL